MRKVPLAIMVLSGAAIAMVTTAAQACGYSLGAGWTQSGDGTPAQLAVLGSETCRGGIRGEGLRIIAPPQHGRVRVTGQSTYQYTPNRAYRGPDQFSVSAVLEGVGLVIGIVAVTVH
jgi:Bacterial Ig domain